MGLHHLHHQLSPFHPTLTLFIPFLPECVVEAPLSLTLLLAVVGANGDSILVILPPLTLSPTYLLLRRWIQLLAHPIHRQLLIFHLCLPRLSLSNTFHIFPSEKDRKPLDLSQKQKTIAVCVCYLCTLSFVIVLLFDSTATNTVLNTVHNSGGIMS